MSFKNAVNNEYNNEETKTTNGMTTNRRTGSAVLDLFGKVGSARKVDLTKEFMASYAEDIDLTLRLMLWTRDIREGAGERQTFRTLLSKLEEMKPELAGKLIPSIIEVGRWDDLFTYKEALNRLAVYKAFKQAFETKNGLAAKWAPRKGVEAVALTKYLGISPKAYRKLIVGLSKTVEQQMCAKQFAEINFSQVPSIASARYQKAFGRNAPEQYSAYIRELQKDPKDRTVAVKINAGAIHPHDVVRSISRGNASVADEQWKALPNYVGDAMILPVVDVSGSMGSINSYNSGNPLPIEVAVALGLYLSDKNTGPFKDLFMTFSNKPEFVQVKGTLSQKVAQMSRAHWEMNTNVEAVFTKILELAKRNKLKSEDMPKGVLILSDMQFDVATRINSWAGGYSAWNPKIVDLVKQMYADAGYSMPRLIFWNLNAGYKNTPVKFDENGTALVSGFSPSIMKAVLANDLEEYTPYNVMLKTLMSERYAISA